MEDKTDKIIVEGPVEEVERVRVALLANVEELLSKLTFADIVVDPKYHKHIIGIKDFFLSFWVKNISLTVGSY